MLEARFTVYAIARRGRGETDASEGHSVLDEAKDVAAVIEAVQEPVFLLGHSYGAHCSLVVASLVPDRVRKLVIYEPAWPQVLTREVIAPLEKLASVGAWDDFAFSFFGDVLQVPKGELEQLRATELWPPIVSDAKASLGDLRAISRYDFKPERFQQIGCPVLLQVGSESPRSLYATDALAAVLPNARIETLAGQAHEGMTTAPELYAAAVTKFLLS
jgi:pimeloyl-ACP methyl ester carboxylesterase